MPIAISNAGLLGGVLGMVFVALVTIHCMHTLVRWGGGDNLVIVSLTRAAQKMVAKR